MNRNQRLNRSKKVRLNSEKHGSAANTANHNPNIIKMAVDKTPIAQRTGNYYTQVKNTTKKSKITYINTKPIHKLRQYPKFGGMFDVVALINKLLAKKIFRIPTLA